MPNVLIDNGKVSGVIDWGQAGVADVSRDFASVETTLRINLDLSHVDHFYKAYGEFCWAYGMWLQTAMRSNATECWRIFFDHFTVRISTCV
jgi:aminoglycoside phosphotransferase